MGQLRQLGGWDSQLEEDRTIGWLVGFIGLDLLIGPVEMARFVGSHRPIKCCDSQSKFCKQDKFFIYFHFENYSLCTANQT